MRCENPRAKLAALLMLATSVSGCATATAVVTPKIGVSLPAPPSFMAPIGNSGVKVGDNPNVAFVQERAAHRRADRALVQSRAWYIGVRQRFQSAKLK